LDHRRLHGADHHVAISQATADDMVELMNVPASKISVVLLGVDTSRWCPEPQANDVEQVAKLGATEPYLLYVGDGDWRKNADGMFEAAARTKHPLVWAGLLSDARLAKLQPLARKLGADVRFLGYVSDAALSALYRRALATLFVSRAEGFGYPVVEAMAAGCPVITSNVSSLPEVAGEAALTVDPDSPDAIAAAITSLDERERERLRRLGLARAATFTRERQARQTLEVYRSLCADTRASR
jgi:glycosyltransferase involved in cell wall biosynthesis